MHGPLPIAAAAAVSVGLALFVWARPQPEATVTLRRDVVILNDGVEDENLLTMLREFLGKKLGWAVRVEKNFVDLSTAYVPSRKQWNYSTMLAAVHQRVRGVGRCVLLTSKDTFGGQLRWSTGVAYHHGTTAVVSVCRLNPVFWGEAPNTDLHYRRTRKITLHELGHTFGRSAHCDDWDCAVHGSNSIHDIDRTGEDYCSDCADLSRKALAAIKR
jgi:archaemetzincin